VLGATVPKAPVDEDDQTRCPPYDVGLTSEVRFWPSVDAKPDAASMKKLPY
jgi:hypothetical protein